MVRQDSGDSEGGWFAFDDVSGTARLWDFLGGPASLELVRDALRRLHELAPVLEPAILEPDVFRTVLREAVTVRAGELADRVRGVGAKLAERGTKLGAVQRILHDLRRGLLQRLTTDDLQALPDVLPAVLQISDLFFGALAQEYLAHRERQLEEQRRSASDSLLWLKRLSESGLLGILVCDIHGAIKDANETFATMIDYSREELVSGTVRWPELTPQEWAPLDVDAVEQLAVHGRTRPWEKEYFRRDGSRVPVLVGVATLSGEDVVAFTLEITERKRSEELKARSLELEAENRRVQEASRLKSEFLANMSHELRTPLNSIIGFADLLHEGEVSTDTPEYREYLGDILNSGRHLLQLINDVLDLAKIESGKMEFRPEHVELQRLVNEVLDVLRSVASANRVTVSCALEPGTQELVIDPARLKQVLYNYLSNALKFTPPGGRVVVRSLLTGPDQITIEIEDTGAGIAPDDIGRLFREFEQLDQGRAKRHAGTGLGLALTRRIVEGQGGTVGVRSELGKGSVFWATLPKHSAGISNDAAVFALQHHRDGALILVVEDDVQDQQLIVHTLNEAGYNVAVASTGKQATQACNQTLFDAITLDLLLPDASGLQVLRDLRSGGLNQSTPVVVVSVIAERQVIRGFAVCDYIDKPIEGSKLLGSLQRAGVVPSEPGSILVVDDDLSSLKLMGTTLRKLGYAVECQSDPVSALERTLDVRHSAIVLDLLMPDMDGFEFLARLRDNPASRDVPVIIWTTRDLSSEDQRLLKKQAQAIFEKGGGRPSSLVDELGSLLRHRVSTAPELS